MTNRRPVQVGWHKSPQDIVTGNAYVSSKYLIKMNLHHTKKL